MILDGPLLFDENAPACAHFALYPKNASVRPFLSFVPSFAEPSEVCTRLLFDLNSLFFRQNVHQTQRSYGNSNSGVKSQALQSSQRRRHTNSNSIVRNSNGSSLMLAAPRMYFVSCGNENFRGQSSVRVTLLVTRDLDSQAWADSEESGCVLLNIEDNAILCRRRCADDRSVWEVASALRWDGKHRKLRVTVCVANGLPLDGTISNPSSEPVVRVHWVSHRHSH